MKFYPYSVKETLESYWGKETVSEMRKPDPEVYGKLRADDLIPRAWQYADEQTCYGYLCEEFLVDTLIEDDYIVYLSQKNSQMKACLMFMIMEDEVPFSPSTDYLASIINHWTEKGYETIILRECIGVEYYGSSKENGYHFVTRSSPKYGGTFYKIEKVNERYLLTLEIESWWNCICQKVLSVSQTQSLAEFECLFSPDTVITEEVGDHVRTIGKGIQDAMRLLHSAPVHKAYQEYKGTKAYLAILLQADKELRISINQMNLISKIFLCPAQEKESHTIITDTSRPFESLVASIPKLKAFRPLDPRKMHGYAIQLKYENNQIRNYYLQCFDTPEIPDQVSIGQYTFTAEEFSSASLDHLGNLVFSNGYSIPRHQLYYHSYRQVNIESLNQLLYKDEHLSIEAVYRIPLKKQFKRGSHSVHVALPDEHWGPKFAWVDDTGNRTSDIALFSIDRNQTIWDATKVEVEPTGKIGFIRKDGSWLIPPVYSAATIVHNLSIIATRTVNGKQVQFSLDQHGTETPLPYPVDPREFFNGLCPFNAEEWKGHKPYMGYYYYEYHDYAVPGKWGFIDAHGNVIVKPQYVYALGFLYSDGKHSAVARYVNGHVLWGVIDSSGKETIPCQYQDFYIPDDDYAIYSVEGIELWGLLGLDGQIITEPLFPCIKEYNRDHHLVTAGEDDEHLGVYSLDQNRMIIPAEYDDIMYMDTCIACEISYTASFRVYDYTGRELDFGDYAFVVETNGCFYVAKNGKRGILDRQMQVVIPPVLNSGSDMDIECYLKGYLITGNNKRYGISDLNGNVLIPEIYSEIQVADDLVIAKTKTDTGWDIIEKLYSLDGKQILPGLQRNIAISDDNHVLTMETPCGIVYCTIARH